MAYAGSAAADIIAGEIKVAARKPWNERRRPAGGQTGSQGAARRHILVEFYDNKQINELAHAHDMPPSECCSRLAVAGGGWLGGGVGNLGRRQA